MVIGIYPGSFDPITFGHIDIAIRAAKLVDKLYLAVVATRSSKSLMFNTEERLELCQGALSNAPNIQVIPYTGLTVNIAKEVGAQVMIRGLRMGSDFDYEFELDLNNQKLAPDLDTVYLMANLEHIYMKSSLIKEIASNKGSVSHLVPNNVELALLKKYDV